MVTESNKNCKENKKVVLLISDKRSGSTLFQRELIKHAEITTLDYSPHTYKESHHWLKGAVMLSHDSPGLFKEGYLGYGSKRNARKYMEDCISGNVEDFNLKLSDEDLIFQGWEALCWKYANPVFFEKSPQIIAHNTALNLLYQWYLKTDYEVKFVFLVRNPMAIMYSAYNLFFSDPNKRQWGWGELMRNMYEFYSKIKLGDKLWVTYEDMVDEPSAFFRRVQEFLGISFNENLGCDANRESKKKWVKDPNFNFQFDPAIVTLINNLGYSEQDINNPTGKKPSMFHCLKMFLNRVLKLPFSRFLDRRIKPLFLKYAK